MTQSGYPRIKEGKKVMKKANLRILVLVVVLASALLITAQSFAQSSSSSKFEPPRNRYLGDVRETMSKIQALPGILDNALCERDTELYIVERQRLATEIENLKWLLVQMNIKNTLDLQSIQGAVNYYSTCGLGPWATGFADREAIKLHRILVRYGLE